jgi:soluble lytic murein transglycosylase-like protein
MNAKPINRRLFLIGSAAVSALGLGGWTNALADSRINLDHSGHNAKVPAGYAMVAREYGVPGIVLFGVALQESEMSSGRRQILPWPWTLNVRGEGLRYPTRQATEAALLGYLRGGTTLVDIGLMQVCWHFWGQRLRSPAIALEPYWNLRVGASILRDHYRDTANWFAAIGRYHAPGDPGRANNYASSVMQRVARTLNA